MLYASTKATFKKQFGTGQIKVQNVPVKCHNYNIDEQIAKNLVVAPLSLMIFRMISLLTVLMISV